LLLTRLGDLEPIGPRDQVRAVLEEEVQEEVEALLAPDVAGRILERGSGRDV
jgi:hypothetical protein